MKDLFNEFQKYKRSMTLAEDRPFHWYETSRIIVHSFGGPLLHHAGAGWLDF